MGAFVKLRAIKCIQSNDSVTDEVMIQQDGQQVWPPGGYYSMSTGNEVELFKELFFASDHMDIALFDAETFGEDDHIGGLRIDASEAGSGLKTRPIDSGDTHYTLTYGVGHKDDI